MSMDVAGISPAVVPDPGLTAWAADAGGVEVHAETVVVQAVVKPPVSAGETPKTIDTTLPRATNALSEFALPASQLVPVTLIGLQVEAAQGWPLLHPGGQAPAFPADVRPPDAEPEASRQHGQPHAQDERDDASADEAPPQAEAGQAAIPAPVIAEVDDSGWCETLTRALRRALASRIPPQALLAAAEQWRRGRCVVLACPQGDDPAGPAWAFVLWPNRAPAARGATPSQTPPLSLVGLRVEARLQWSAPPHDGQWCHVRVVKEHHPRSGRQLVVMEDAGHPDTTSRVACEVQLGPVLARSLRWCEVCVRIHAVQRFWNALGTQWSVHVVVCSQPLAGARAQTLEETSPC